MKYIVKLELDEKELYAREVEFQEVMEIIFLQAGDKKSLNISVKARGGRSEFKLTEEFSVPSGSYVQIKPCMPEQSCRRFSRDEIARLTRLHSTMNPEEYGNSQLHIATKDCNFIVRARENSDISSFYEIDLSGPDESRILSVGTMSKNYDSEQWMKKTLSPGELVEFIYFS